jgi:hypothetical protein
MFRRHFGDGGMLSSTRIADVIKGGTDDKIIYDGHNNVYLDCHHDILESIAKKTYEEDLEYFIGSVPKHDGGNIESEMVDSDVLKQINLSDLPEDIDTSASPIYEGGNHNIDDLIKDIQNDIPINNESKFTSELETDVEYNGSLKTKYVRLN